MLIQSVKGFDQPETCFDPRVLTPRVINTIDPLNAINVASIEIYTHQKKTGVDPSGSFEKLTAHILPCNIRKLYAKFGSNLLRFEAFMPGQKDIHTLIFIE
jgi:hypothetical protein